MRYLISTLVVTGALVLSGCVTPRYTEPEISGLEAGAPYPSAGDVCVSASANAATAQVTSEKDGLIACPNHERGAIADRERDGFQIAGPVQGWTVLQREPITNGQKTSSESSGLVNRTTVFFDDFHGTQVAYFNSNGTEWLWYPGNRIALKGFWEVSGSGKGQKICFQYPNSGLNPATGVAGPEWECSSMEQHKQRIVEQTDGDIFNLSSGRIPFVMAKRRAFTIEQLQR